MLQIRIIPSFAVYKLKNSLNKSHAIPKAALTYPFGNMGDQAGLGFGLGGTFRYIIDKRYSAEGSLFYLIYGSKDTTSTNVIGTTTTVETSWRVIPILAGVRYKIDRMYSVIGGFGYYLVKVKAKTASTASTQITSASASDGNLGLYLGCSIVIEKDFVVEPSFHYVITDGDAATFVMVTGGYRFPI